MDTTGAGTPNLGRRTARNVVIGSLILAISAIAIDPALASAPTAIGTSKTSSSVTSAPPASTGESASTVPASLVTTTAATTRVLSVPVYSQAYNLSCEESALRMALASEGIFVTDAQVLAIIGSDTTAAYTDSSGLRWGDPYTTFVGSVYGSETNFTGYGTYFPTIAAAARSLGGTVLAAGEGISAQTVYSSVLAGHPVVAWVTYQWVDVTRCDYVAFDGRVIPYAGPVEHAVTVVGVTPTQVYINNPDAGLQVISKTLFESSYATYNNMAVVLA